MTLYHDITHDSVAIILINLLGNRKWELTMFKKYNESPKLIS